MKTTHGHRITSSVITLFVAVTAAGHFSMPCMASDSADSMAAKKIGLGATAPEGAELLFDGTREMLDEKWTYWEGPRFSSSLPIKWKIAGDPVDRGNVLAASDPAARRREIWGGGYCDQEEIP